MNQQKRISTMRRRIKGLGWATSTGATAALLALGCGTAQAGPTVNFGEEGFVTFNYAAQLWGQYREFTSDTDNGDKFDFFMRRNRLTFHGRYSDYVGFYAQLEATNDAKGESVAGGESVWWMTPGWIKFREDVFRGWDQGLANENFPRHTGGAVVLDGIGYLDRYMAEKPEAFLAYSDWMGIPIQGYPVSLDRFKSLLAEAAERL